MTARVWLVLLLCAAACGDDPGGPAGGEADAAPHPPTSTTLVVMVTDSASGAPLPAKVVLYDAANQRVRIGRLDMYDGAVQDRGYCELNPGVIGTWDGIALADGSGDIPVGDDFCNPSPAIPFGSYRLRVMRGIDYEMYETQVTLGEKMGRVVVHAPLERAWTAEGALSADLHVHCDPSNDSNVPEPVRVIAELVTGIQVIGASDHNFNGNYQAFIEQMGLRGQIASLSGNEVSVDLMHANVFPALVEPGKVNGGARPYEELNRLSARQLIDSMRGLPRAPLVQLNHPRLRYAAYFDTVGWDGKTWPPPMPVDFDAIEILTGWYTFNVPGDRRLEEAIRDLYTLIQHGQLITATGNSDTHHLSSILAGLPRNYVLAPGTGLDPFDEDAFVSALRSRRVVVTGGPWLSVHAGAAGPGEMVAAAAGAVPLTIALRQASYVHANRVRIWVGNTLRETLAVPDGARSFDWSGSLPVGPADTWIGVDADGDIGIPVELAGGYLEGTGGPAPAALINPILVDGDGNGRWSMGAKPLPPVDVPAPPPSDRPPDCGPPGGV